MSLDGPFLTLETATSASEGGRSRLAGVRPSSDNCKDGKDPERIENSTRTGSRAQLRNASAVSRGCFGPVRPLSVTTCSEQVAVNQPILRAPAQLLGTRCC